MEVNETPRLRYSLMTEPDAELLFQLDQDPQVMEFITGGKMTTREEIKEVYIPRMQKYTDAEKGWGLWGVTVKEANEFIGWILIRPMNFFNEQPEFDNLEIGWRFNRASWGKGYATEAAKAIAETLEQQKCYRALSAIAIAENKASINVMKKLGMSYIKTYVNRDPLGDMECVYYTRVF